MPWKEKEKICKGCNQKFTTRDNRKSFCSQSCSSKFNNARRDPPTDEQKNKIKESLIKFYEEHPEKKTSREQGIKQGIESAKGRFRETVPTSILEVSKRTTSKILKRLGLGCSYCGWDKGTCDIHHINGRKIEDADHHSNLALICPNCHRLVHEGKLSKDELISLDKYIPDNWVEYYYG